MKNFLSPLPISFMYGFLGGGVDCGIKGLEALACELSYNSLRSHENHKTKSKITFG